MERNLIHRPEFALKTAKETQISNIKNQTVPEAYAIPFSRKPPSYFCEKDYTDNIN